MEIERKLLKDLYYRSIAVGLEYAEINGFKYTYKSKYSVLIGIEPFILESSNKIFVPNCFDRISFNYYETNKYKEICTNVKLYFGTGLKYICSRSFKNACWLDELYIPCVKKIGNSCFDFSTIKKVIAPKLVELGSSCFFESCIEKIFCPNLTKIGRNCFFGCSKLVEINTKKVVKAGNNSFSHCTSLDKLDLRSLTFLSSNMLYDLGIRSLRLDTINGYSFNNMVFSQPLDLYINLFYDIYKILELFTELENLYLYYDNMVELEEFKVRLKSHTYNIFYIKKEKK